MKGIYFTDTHIKGRNPASRIDDYPAALYRKFQEIYEVVKAEKPDFVVHGGDFFDTPMIADSIKNKYLRILRKIKKHTQAIYLVPGNHDLYGYSMDTIDQTAVGILASSGVVKLLTHDKSYEIKPKNAKHPSVIIHGREYDRDIDKDPASDYDINVKKADKTKLHFLFSHGMLLQKPFHPDVPHSLTKDVITDADLVLNGHYHNGYPLHEENGTTFGNPGSTGRDEGSKETIKRTPQYAIIDTDGSYFSVGYEEFKCAAAGKDVFDRTPIEQRKSYEKHLQSFEQTLQDAVTFEAYNPKDTLTELAKTNKIDKAITQEAFDAIIDAEKLSSVLGIENYVEKAMPIGIDSVEIENFQSHKKTKIDFNKKGLNAITGPSDSGKSGVIRAIRWAQYNDPKGTDFIRHGAARASVKINYTDGSSIMRSRTNSSSGEYVVTDKKGKETVFKGFGSNMPADIMNTHQMPKVELAPGIEKPINFAFQLDGHFLLSESASVRASAIGRLTGVHIVDAAIKEKAKEMRGLTVDLNAKEKEIEAKTIEIESFNELDDLEHSINRVEGLIKAAESLESNVTELQGLHDEYEKMCVQASDITMELADYDDISTAEAYLEQAEVRLLQIHNLTNMLNSYKREQDDFVSCKRKLVKYKDMKDLDDVIDNLDSGIKELASLNAMHDDYVVQNKSYNHLKKELKQYDWLDDMPDLSALQDSLDEISKLKELQSEYNKQLEQENQLEKSLEFQDINRSNIKDQMEKLFDELGNQCPTCYQAVDDVSHIIEHI